MKKAAVYFSVLLIFVCCFTASANAESISYDEAVFEVGDNYVLILEDAMGLEWMTEDEKTELRFSQLPNYENDNFSNGEFLWAEMFYENYVCEDETEIYGSDTFVGFEDSTGIEVYGKTFVNDKMLPFRAFLFSTNQNVYVFEFIIHEGDAEDFNPDIDSVVESVYIVNSGWNETSVESSDDISVAIIIVVIGVIGIGAIAGIAYLFKTFSAQTNTPSSDTVQEISNGFKEIADEVKEAMPKLTGTKFELNGKSINSFNERFSIGSKDDNFALKELEKERRDRENMFK